MYKLGTMRQIWEWGCMLPAATPSSPDKLWLRVPLTVRKLPPFPFCSGDAESDLFSLLGHARGDGTKCTVEPSSEVYRGVRIGLLTGSSQTYVSDIPILMNFVLPGSPSTPALDQSCSVQEENCVMAHGAHPDPCSCLSLVRREHQYAVTASTHICWVPSPILTHSSGSASRASHALRATT